MYKEMLMEYAEFAKTASAEEIEALAKDVLEGLSKLASGEDTSKDDGSDEDKSEDKEEPEESDEKGEDSVDEKKAYTISELIKSAGLGEVEYLEENSISSIIKSAGLFRNEEPAPVDDNGSTIGGAIGAAGLLAAGAGAVGLARKGKQGYHAAALSLSESKKKAAEAAAAKHKQALGGKPGMGATPGSSSDFDGSFTSDKPLAQHKLKEESKKMDNRVATNFKGSDGRMYTRDMEAITGDAKSLERADFLNKHKKAIIGTAAGVGTAAYLSNENSKKEKELQGAYGVGRR